MKTNIAFLMIAASLFSCSGKISTEAESPSTLALSGTWKLISGTLIEKGDTVVTSYTQNTSFIKILNNTHFAFLQHDLSKGHDSIPVYVSGGGSYTLKDSTYTEHLEYCSVRNWEGTDFIFTMRLQNDTLIQSGVEKVEAAGINRMNIEKYVRVKK